MRFEVSDSGGLERLIERLESAAGGGLVEPVAEACGEVAVELVERGFAEGTDPSGDAWTPTKKGNQPLIGETLELSTSATYEPQDDGFTVFVMDEKAVFHQDGTERGIPARPMLPDGDSLPDAWQGPIDEAGAKAMRMFFGGG